MQKFITCRKSNELFVVKFCCNKVHGILRMVYEIYIIKNKSKYDSLEAGLKDNPESETIFDNASPEKVLFNSLSQMNVGEELSKFNLNYNMLNEFGTLKLPKISLKIENYKIIIIYNFMKYFFDNYEIINQNYSVEKTNNSLSNIITLPEIIKLVNEDNTSIYYLSNLINNFNYDKNKNIYELNNKTLKLFMNSFVIDNNSVIIKNLFIMTMNLNKSTPEELNFSLKLGFKYLIKIINSEVIGKETIEEDVLIKINVLNVICFIYGARLFINDKFDLDRIKPLSILNNMFLMLIKNYKNLEYDRIEIVNIIGGGDIVDLNKISKKYKYLIDISKEEFLKAIIKDIKPLQKDNKFELILNSPKILNIDYILESNNNTSSLISYSKIQVPDFIKLKTNYVITNEYLQILYLMNSGGFIDKSKLDFRITKFSDLIINSLIPNLNKYHDFLVNTLLIITKVIDNEEKEMIDVNLKLFLLYRICIPHLHNQFSVTKILDYFQ